MDCFGDGVDICDGDDAEWWRGDWWGYKDPIEFVIGKLLWIGEIED